jgi:hypothetical protein
MSRLRSCLLLFLCAAASRLNAAGTSSTSLLAGSWHIDLARSTELSPWKDYKLTVSIEGDRITIHRSLAWGPREFTDSMTIGANRTEIIPVEMWPDNRHLGAYIGGDRTKHVHAEWLDDHRILRVSSDLVLDTQQGSHAVNTLSDYKVSASGNQLTLTELRSTRNRPVVYVFTRVASLKP